MTEVEFGLLPADKQEEVLQIFEARALEVASDPVKHFVPLPSLIDFYEDNHSRVLAVFGGNRSGKTHHGAAKVIKFALETPGAVIWCATQTSEVSFRIQQKKIWDLLPKDDPRIAYAKYSPEGGFVHKSVRYTNSSIIIFKSYDQGSRTFGGEDCDIIWFDEEPEDKGIYTEGLFRLINRDGRLIITATPVLGMTWLYYDIYENNGKNGIKCWFADTRDNIYNSQKTIADICKLIDSEEEKLTRLEGRFMRRAGLIYPMYKDQAPHVIKQTPIPVTWNRYVFIDPHGGRKGQYAAWIALSPHDQVVCYNELVFDGKLKDFAVLILEISEREIKNSIESAKQSETYNPQYLIVPHIKAHYIDTSGNKLSPVNMKSAKMVLYENNIQPIFDVVKGADSVDPGILAVKERLRLNDNDMPSLFVMEHCHETRSELRNYVYDDPKRNIEIKKDMPKKVEDHFPDLIRYFCYMGFRYAPPISEEIKKATNSYKPNYEAVH